MILEHIIYVYVNPTIDIIRVRFIVYVLAFIFTTSFINEFPVNFVIS